MDKRMQGHEAYRDLPARVVQQVLRTLGKNWSAFFAALAAYEEDLSRFRTRPHLPGYKHKTAGCKLLACTIHALSTSGLRQELIQPFKLQITLKTKRPVSTIS